MEAYHNKSFVFVVVVWYPS